MNAIHAARLWEQNTGDAEVALQETNNLRCSELVQTERAAHTTIAAITIQEANKAMSRPSNDVTAAIIASNSP